MRTAQPFRIPQGMSILQQKEYCLSIVQKQREELSLLRNRTTYCQTYHETCDERIQAWKNKYQLEHEEKEKFRKDYENLRKENEKLKRELETKAKTAHRLLQALFLHGNFKKRIPGQRKNGGQFGHKDTNQDKNRD